jgi:hypothetical protein
MILKQTAPLEEMSLQQTIYVTTTSMEMKSVEIEQQTHKNTFSLH